MNWSKSNILVVSISVEVFLALLFYSWTKFTGIEFDFLPDAHDVYYGALAVLPLFIVNFILFGPFFSSRKFFEPFRLLRDKVVRPLAAELNIFSAFFISACAGFGEELFFRGLVQHELGLIAANVLFSLLHFGFLLRQFFWVALVYFFIGIYFSFLTVYFKRLWVPVFAHFIYDFCILVFMKYWKAENLSGVTQHEIA